MSLDTVARMRHIFARHGQRGRWQDAYAELTPGQVADQLVARAIPSLAPVIEDLRRVALYLVAKDAAAGAAPDTPAGVLALILNARADIQAKADERNKVKAVVHAMQGEIGRLEVTLHDTVKAAVAAGTIKVHTTYVTGGKAVSVTPKADTDDTCFHIHVTDLVTLD